MSNSKTSTPVIAKKIKLLRLKQGLSQNRLPKLADKSLRTITKIESIDTLNPTIETVHKIVKAFDVSIDYLLNPKSK